ncbi:MAG: NAD(P)/FAD-dependent oxidoreductase, partial [Alphaproteobacteria bacterium]|nr:NAD(P)/FAD-dependent oxidoreductase [Alphaproteobacteria bacterium]
MKNGVVIIGTGHAGVQAAASLREEGFSGRIALIGNEGDLPYHKPPLSKTFIKDPDAKPQILRAEAFYSGAAIELITGETVAAIDPAASRVRLLNGTTIPFGHAIIATGARPRPLSIEGGPLGGVLSLRSLADARAIRERAAGAEDVVVMGGGFIGLEIAATLAAGGRRVTVIEAQDRLLARAVAPVVAAHVARRLEASGVRILTATTIARLEGHAGDIAAVETSAGERIAARLLVVGIGVVPNSRIAEEAGLAVGNGIAVDQQLRTGAQNILAI